MTLRRIVDRRASLTRVLGLDNFLQQGRDSRTNIRYNRDGIGAEDRRGLNNFEIGRGVRFNRGALITTDSQAARRRGTLGAQLSFQGDF